MGKNETKPVPAMNTSHHVRRPQASVLASGLVGLVNAVGGGLRALGASIGQRSDEQLLEAARRKTSLADFGADGFRLPMRTLLQASGEAGRLNFTGQVLSELRVVRALVNRLLITSELKRHPEILEVAIQRPIFIASLPRTGTTLLHKLLAQDPHARPLRAWEALLPARRAADVDKVPDPRIARIRRLARVLRVLAPRLRTLHDFDPDGPEECIMFLQDTFVVPLPGVPTYLAWYLRQPASVIEAAYAEYRQHLQLLHWQRPHDGHWVLKCPAHLFAIDAILAHFPDAAIILIHREPSEVIGSTCSLLSVYTELMAAEREEQRDALPGRVTHWVAAGLRRAEAARERAAPGRIFDISYQELVADPLGAVQRLYAYFGYPYDRAFEMRATQWLVENPQHKYGRHTYGREQFGLERHAIDDTFAWYRDRYGIRPR